MYMAIPPPPPPLRRSLNPRTLPIGCRGGGDAAIPFRGRIKKIL